MIDSWFSKHSDLCKVNQRRSVKKTITATHVLFIFNNLVLYDLYLKTQFKIKLYRYFDFSCILIIISLLFCKLLKTQLYDDFFWKFKCIEIEIWLILLLYVLRLIVISLLCVNYDLQNYSVVINYE